VQAKRGAARFQSTQWFHPNRRFQSNRYAQSIQWIHPKQWFQSNRHAQSIQWIHPKQ
jgi:hypothetical protein